MLALVLLFLAVVLLMLLLLLVVTLALQLVMAVVERCLREEATAATSSTMDRRCFRRRRRRRRLHPLRRATLSWASPDWRAVLPTRRWIPSRWRRRNSPRTLKVSWRTSSNNPLPRKIRRWRVRRRRLPRIMMSRTTSRSTKRTMHRCRSWNSTPCRGSTTMPPVSRA